MKQESYIFAGQRNDIIQNSCVKGSRVTTWFSKGNIDQEGSAAQMNDARKSLMNT